MVVRWSIWDPTTSTTTAFEINPVAGGTPTKQKQINYQSTAAPDGKLLVFEGRDQPQEIKFNGTILYESQYTQFNTWFNLRHQVLLTDDLGRQFWIYFTSFEATRKRRRSHPWAHDYAVTATILDVP